MIIGGLFALFYGFVAFMAAMMTLWEQKRRDTALHLRIAGFALCMVWPVTVVVMLVVIQLRGMPSRGGPDKMAGAAVKAQ